MLAVTLGGIGCEIVCSLLFKRLENIRYGCFYPLEIDELFPAELLLIGIAQFKIFLQHQQRYMLMRKLFFSFALLGTLALTVPAFSQAVEIHVRPPKLKVEKRPAPPDRTMVWQRGYYTYDANANNYTWQGGQWVAPPKPHSIWVAPTYVHHHDHWTYVEGHWR